jgi:hypothetical protein
LEDLAARRYPSPVTVTDFRLHFIPAGTEAEHYGAVAFVTAWLDREAVRNG